MNWNKKGLLIDKAPDGYTHASHPTAVQIENDLYLIAYCGRDINRHSHVFFVKAKINGGSITIVSEPVLTLSPGPEGSFSCHGILTCNFVYDEKVLYLYYCGWQNIAGGMWHCDTGRAIVDPNEMKAVPEFVGPIMGRSKDVPLWAVATAVRKERPSEWVSWYNRGLSWRHDGTAWIAKYGIHYAHSENGIDWICEDTIVIPFKDGFEHSFGRPTVLVHKEMYFMWFAARGANGDERYRIGLAASSDGRTWVRSDAHSGLSVSRDGWDSDAVCYPFIISHKEQLYMLYNGNNYGISGFGYAVAKTDQLDNLYEHCMIKKSPETKS